MIVSRLPPPPLRGRSVNRRLQQLVCRISQLRQPLGNPATRANRSGHHSIMPFMERGATDSRQTRHPCSGPVLRTRRTLRRRRTDLVRCLHRHRDLGQTIGQITTLAVLRPCRLRITGTVLHPRRLPSPDQSSRRRRHHHLLAITLLGSPPSVGSPLRLHHQVHTCLPRSRATSKTSSRRETPRLRRRRRNRLPRHRDRSRSKNELWPICERRSSGSVYPSPCRRTRRVRKRTDRRQRRTRI